MYELAVIFCAKYLIWLVVLAGLAFLFFTRSWRRAALSALLTLPLAYGLGKLAGHFWYNARPFVVGHFTPLVAHANNNGFPSDHTLFAGAIASVVFLYNRKAGIALWVATLLIGAARVLAGVHHAVDIIGAIAIVVVAVAVVELLLVQVAKRVNLSL